MTERVQIQGICFDEKSSFLRGPSKAPALIREALFSPSANQFSEAGREIGKALLKDNGDYTPSDYFDIREQTAQCLTDNMPLVTLGGDHSITYPVIQAFAEKYGPLNILHFDAHGDLYDDFEGDPYSHACPFARIIEEGLCSQLVQVGLRTLTPAQRAKATSPLITQFEMKDLPEKLPKMEGPLYISLDLDVLDPAFAPGVSHHEPGGMTTRQLLDYLRQVDQPLVGADLVEYNPKRDLNGVTAMTAAKLLKEIVALCL